MKSKTNHSLPFSRYENWLTSSFLLFPIPPYFPTTFQPWSEIPDYRSGEDSLGLLKWFEKLETAFAFSNVRPVGINRRIAWYYIWE